MAQLASSQWQEKHVINAARGMRHCVKRNFVITHEVVQRFKRNCRLLCLCTVAILGGCRSAADVHRQSFAPAKAFLWPCGNPACLHLQTRSKHAWRRQLLSGLLGVASLPMVQEVHADAPIAFDYRKLEELDPSKKVIVGDRGSAEVVAAIAKLRKARAGALQAKEMLKEDPLADIQSLFGLTSAADTGDSLLAAFQGGKTGAGLEGPFAAGAKEQRAACSAIGSIMDGKTRADTDRTCRITIAAWYNIIKDKEMRPIQIASQGDTRAEINRRRPAVQGQLTAKIDGYVAALDVLLKFVE
mmetsp:Transcript_62679/g.123923  ORF Transcript_62679/g.123923 Transcript_62679/m.123923 type:complete len:300 (-) Transcript_62679:63-962(-)